MQVTWGFFFKRCAWFSNWENAVEKGCRMDRLPVSVLSPVSCYDLSFWMDMQASLETTGA